MMTFLFVIIISFFSIIDGQPCHGEFNATISGQCSSVDSCQGAVLAVGSCEQERCCVNGTSGSSLNNCINANDFDILYNTSRATFLRSVLNYGINSAGICLNCQAKAAFLAIAAAMTDDFQKDEATGTDAQFADDDTKYGNTQAGDGSRFRRRGFFGLRGREMYGQLQTLMPKYQSLTNPEVVALTQNAIDIAALLWINPQLSGGKLQVFIVYTFYLQLYIKDFI
jgi:hypothetical protein